jgi:hypothetical protein
MASLKNNKSRKKSIVKPKIVPVKAKVRPEKSVWPPPEVSLKPVVSPAPAVASPSVRKEDYMPSDLINYLRSLTRFILVRTEEEQLFIKRFSEVMIKFEPNTWVFNMEFGLKPITEYLKVEYPTFPPSREAMLKSSHKAVDAIRSHDPREREDYYLITDPEVWFSDPYLVRRLVNLAIKAQSDQRVVKCLVFVGHPSVQVPPKLRQFFEISEYGSNNTRVAVREAASVLVRALVCKLPDNVDYLFSDLTTYEVESAIIQSIIKTKKDPVNPKSIDPDFVRQFRAERLRMREVVG